MGKKSPFSDIEAARYPPPPPPTFYMPPPTQWFSWLVPLFFLANIAMFVYSMYINDCPGYLNEDDCLWYQYLGKFSFQPFNENPLLGPSVRTLRVLGALERDLVVGENEVWRFITCMFLHAGVIHLLANMFSLLFIGVRLENEFGFLKIGVLYLLSGFGGSLLSILHMGDVKAPNTVSVGASGALFGLLGAMLSELLTNWTIYLNKCAALTSLLLIIGLNLAVGFIPHVDNSAHIGGFLSGFFLGFVILMRPQFGYVNNKYIPPGYDAKRKSKYKGYQYFFLVLSVITLLIGYAYGLATLYIGESNDVFSYLGNTES
ncbi:putative rhomboid protease [Medicago truncatula]|uniref:RHOMBOID-like protein n=1 Tax=Medicago truncatula TaxID=3880 RepID=G7IUV4_MEDTR|nr:RHOMBOID-like protein 5 [Medicago truncatula]AES68133.2 S54 family peptidase [Medicago truncatula]RHN76511.1 putative rhomboid protease [Medicago truncatula]